MSRAEAAPRILEAAIALGQAQGVGALSLQAIATAAGVSKALVLYHFTDKDRLLLAIAERLVEQDVEALGAVAAAGDALEAWRVDAGASTRREARALLVALLQEAALRADAARLHQARVSAAVGVGSALLAHAGLAPKVGTALLGRLVLQVLDGMAVTPRERALRDAELDAAALALLSLGR